MDTFCLRTNNFEHVRLPRAEKLYSGIIEHHKSTSPQVRKSASPQSQHLYRHRQKEKELDFSISFVVPVRGRICGGTDLDRWKRSLLVSVLLNCTVARIAECYVYVLHTTSMLYNAIWYGFCRVTRRADFADLSRPISRRTQRNIDDGMAFRSPKNKIECIFIWCFNDAILYSWIPWPPNI